MLKGRTNGYSEQTRNGYSTKGDSVSGVGGRPEVAEGKFSEIFPCTDPVNPHYRGYGDRIRSFQARPWQQHKHTPSPHELAAAGLFYLGDRDRCKCYYCNGGLQNWEAGDDPMEEHAKYFPQCEFVLQHKGPDYVAELNAKFPNLSRPGSISTQFQQTLTPSQQNNVLNNQTGYQIPTLGVAQNGSFTNDAVPFHLTSGNEENDQSSTRGREEELFNQALTFGFDRNLIKNVLARQQRVSGTPYNSLGDLIDALISSEADRSIGNAEQRMDLCGHEIRNHITEMPQREVMADNTDNTLIPDLKSQLHSAVDESICVICHNRERSCVFMNCGHLTSCYECGKGLTRCPTCNMQVLAAIRVYKP